MVKWPFLTVNKFIGEIWATQLNYNGRWLPYGRSCGETPALFNNTHNQWSHTDLQRGHPAPDRQTRLKY